MLGGCLFCFVLFILFFSFCVGGSFSGGFDFLLFLFCFINFFICLFFFCFCFFCFLFFFVGFFFFILIKCIIPVSVCKNTYFRRHYTINCIPLKLAIHIFRLMSFFCFFSLFFFVIYLFIHLFIYLSVLTIVNNIYIF